MAGIIFTSHCSSCLLVQSHRTARTKDTDHLHCLGVGFCEESVDRGSPPLFVAPSLGNRFNASRPWLWSPKAKEKEEEEKLEELS